MKLQFHVNVPAEFRESRFWHQIRECYIDETSYFYDMISSIENDGRFQNWTDRRRRLVVAVDDATRVVGIGCIEKNGAVNVFVRPRVRRRGIGRQLYRQLQSISDTLGWDDLQPGCRHDSISSYFYSSLEDSVKSSSITW